MVRRRLALILVFAAVLHAVGIARTPLPAQDGLKFIRVAREFWSQPWDSVVRGSDQHPLYPALIAAARPAVGMIIGPGPESWRIAAQAVSAAASLLTLVALFAIGRSLFGPRAGLLAALLWAVLPLPAEIGRDTLSDPTALLCASTALWLGLRSLERRGGLDAVGCGLVAGLGYLARPEVALVPVALIATSVGRSILDSARAGRGFIFATSPIPGRHAALGVAFLAIVGAYALVKGEVSEKLALRRVAAIPSDHDQARRIGGHPMPAMLDGPGWDFSPKEESEAPAALSPVESFSRVGGSWAEGLGWVLVPFAILGVARGQATRRWVPVAAYAGLFAAVLARHGTLLGYVSGRHTLTLAMLSLPWAAAGLISFGRRLPRRLGLEPSRARRLRAVGLAVLIVSGVGLQLKPAHASRWGHREAGRWLAEHAEPGDAVLDTRGWAAFASGLRTYDYWHVGQAFTDHRLAFVVVGIDELEADSQRAETLRTWLAEAGQLAVTFPARRGGKDDAVRVYRFQRPTSWEEPAR